MADKRATPEAPGDGRRHKREAPTIDLKATEIPAPQDPAAEAAAEPPETSEPPAPPPPQPETSEPSSSPPPQPDAERPRRITDYGVALAAGFAGAVITSAILAALWYDGLLPPRRDNAAAPNAQIEALEKQVQSLRHDVQNRPGDRSTAERLSTTENALKSLGHRDDSISADAKQARESAEAVQKTVSDLRAKMQNVANPSGVAPEALDALRKRVASLDQSVMDAQQHIAKAAANSAATDKAARLALSAAALRSAVESGAPYANVLTQAKALGADAAKLASLSPFAHTGVPSAALLSRELRNLLPALRKASGTHGAAGGGFLERLQANAGRLVRIRPLDAPSSDAPADLLTRIEADATKADIDGALADLARLPDAARKPAEAWIAKARQRQAALAAARDFARTSALALGKS